MVADRSRSNKPHDQPKGPHVLATQRSLVTKVVRLHRRQYLGGDIDVEHAIFSQGAVLQRIGRVLRLGQVLVGERTGVNDDEPAVDQVRQIRYQRSRVHRDQHVDGVAGRGDVVGAEIDLERGYAETSPRRAP